MKQSNYSLEKLLDPVEKVFDFLPGSKNMLRNKYFSQQKILMVRISRDGMVS